MNATNLQRLFATAFLGLLFYGCSGRAQETFSHTDEAERITSPTGVVDAVLIRKGYGGAAGGFEWYVSIVPSGSAARLKTVVFHAGSLSGERLAWTAPHLLEIRYDTALIENFRNLWGLNEVQDVGSTGQRDYGVEIRLVPSTPDYSLLTPDGRFRPVEGKK